MAVVLIPSARTAVTDQVSEFIVSTSTNNGAGDREPQEKQDRRQQREGG